VQVLGKCAPTWTEAQQSCCLYTQVGGACLYSGILTLDDQCLFLLKLALPHHFMTADVFWYENYSVLKYYISNTALLHI